MQTLSPFTPHIALCKLLRARPKAKHFAHYIVRGLGADGRTRTGTRLPSLAPQANASTNSATSALDLGYSNVRH